MTTQTETEPWRCSAGGAHHWVIESPNGPTSPGECKKCRSSKPHPNSTPDHIWEGKGGIRKGSAAPSGMGLGRFVGKAKKAQGHEVA